RAAPTRADELRLDLEKEIGPDSATTRLLMWGGEMNALHARRLEAEGVHTRGAPFADRVGRKAIAVAVAVALAPASMPSFGQSDPGIEEVIVTGSRIVRRDFSANSPIVTLESDSFENISTVAIETVLNQLPQFVPALTQFATMDVQNSATNTPGASTVNLRGLGSNRNLVLIDGRRGQPLNGALIVDINAIPSAAVERVEIITGGASAVYGADAVSGVVNFILKKDFEGLEVSTQYGTTEYGDANELRVSALMGANLNG